MVERIADQSTRDAFVIGAQQAIEHHEIAAYGTARSRARQLGQHEIANLLLQQSLSEEEQTDRLLSALAERLVNPQASAA